MQVDSVCIDQTSHVLCDASACEDMYELASEQSSQVTYRNEQELTSCRCSRSERVQIPPHFTPSRISCKLGQSWLLPNRTTSKRFPPNPSLQRFPLHPRLSISYRATLRRRSSTARILPCPSLLALLPLQHPATLERRRASHAPIFATVVWSLGIGRSVPAAVMARPLNKAHAVELE